MATDTPLISIALSMRDAQDTIAAAIRSLIAQTLGDWELLLIDDGSADRSVEVAKSFDDARIHVLVDGVRRGLAARLNQAIDLARGRYLARMDADDIAYPERLARQAAFLDAHAEIDLVGAGMLVFEGEGKPVGLFPTRSSHEEICARPFSGFYLAHPTWCGRSAWFRRWHYDPTCLKAQDQDLLLRAYSSSRYAGLGEPLVGYRQDEVSVRKSALGRYHFSLAILRVAARDRHLVRGSIAVAEQVVKLGFDALAVMSGRARQLLRHRASPFTDAQAQAWQQVWASVHPAGVAAD